MSNTIVSSTPVVADVPTRDWKGEVSALLVHGAPEDIRREGEKVAASAGAGLVPWFALAFDIHTARGMEGQAFSDLVGGNGKNYLLRMRNAHVLYTVHAEKGRPLNAITAMRLGNVLSGKRTDEIAGEVRKGRDPLKTSTGAPVADRVKNTDEDGKDTRETRPASEKARKVTPATYAEILTVIMGRAGEIPEADRATALAAVLSIAATLESAGVVPADLTSAE
jgi:hypothetical protein